MALSLAVRQVLAGLLRSRELLLDQYRSIRLYHHKHPQSCGLFWIYIVFLVGLIVLSYLDYTPLATIIKNFVHTIANC